MKRRIVSVLMALVMALSLLPVQALAEDAAVGEPVTEIEQAEQTGEGEEPGDPEEQTGEGEEPGDPEEEQEPGEPEEPVREFVQGEAQLTVSTAAMAAGTAAAEVGTAADLTAALGDSANGVVRRDGNMHRKGKMQRLRCRIWRSQPRPPRESGERARQGRHHQRRWQHRVLALRRLRQVL